MAGLRGKPAGTVNCAYLKDAQQCSWERQQESCTNGDVQKLAKMPCVELEGLRGKSLSPN